MAISLGVYPIFRHTHLISHLNHHFSWCSPPFQSIFFSMSRRRVTWRACWRILRSCHDPSWRSGSPGGRRSEGFSKRGDPWFFTVSIWLLNGLYLWILYGFYMDFIWILYGFYMASWWWLFVLWMDPVLFCWKSAVCRKFFESSYRVHIYLQ